MNRYGTFVYSIHNLQMYKYNILSKTWAISIIYISVTINCYSPVYISVLISVSLAGFHWYHLLRAVYEINLGT